MVGGFLIRRSWARCAAYLHASGAVHHVRAWTGQIALGAPHAHEVALPLRVAAPGGSRPARPAAPEWSVAEGHAEGYFVNHDCHLRWVRAKDPSP